MSESTLLPPHKQNRHTHSDIHAAATKPYVRHVDIHLSAQWAISVVHMLEQAFTFISSVVGDLHY